MLKIKGTVLFLLLFIFSSCGEYSKVLNKGTIEQQYILATKMYEKGKYSKAIKLFEKITKGFEGKPQLERIQYMISDSYYQTKQFTLSSYYFEKFTTNYPNSTKVEEAAYYSAHSYFMLSPTFSLDQTATYEALEAMQKFIDKYPDSDRIETANQHVKDLRYKLETKAYKTARQYYHIGDFTAAITSFDLLLSEHFGTTYKEEALYYKFRANHDLAMKSVLSKKEARLRSAVKAYEKFKRNYPESKHIEEVDKLHEDIQEKLSDFSLLVSTTEN